MPPSTPSEQVVTKELGPSSTALESKYFSPCAAPSSFANCCYAFWCGPCYAAQIKAELDGRPAECFDCCFAYEADLYIRRQLRSKYNLHLDIKKGSFGCDGTYEEDIWKPCGFACCLSLPRLCPMIFALAFHALPGVTRVLRLCRFCDFLWALPYLAIDFNLIASDSEQKRRNQGRPFTYGADGFTISTNNGAYQSGVWDCMADMKLCCYVCWCPSCAEGHMAARLQGRECDCCDCCGTPGAYLLRKTLKSKYGIPQESCADCCLVCFCSTCVLVQDYKELEARGSSSNYLPVSGTNHIASSVQLPLVAPGVVTTIK